jgi:NADP-dependent 3-hydroxy acid dehydrogenase YdfG
MTQSYVVIGAYGGVGEALCRRLVQSSAHVLMAGRDAERLAQLAADVGGETFALDATSTEEVEACLRRAVEVFGRVDGVAHGPPFLA